MHKLRLILFPVLLSIAAFAGQVRQLAMIELPGRPGFDEIAFAAGHLVIAHRGANTVDILDPAKRRLVGRIEEMAGPRGIAVDEAAGRVYIANADANSIAVISTKTWKLEDNIGLNFSPDALAFLPETQTLYVGEARGDSVSAIALGRGHQISSAQIGGRPACIVFDATRKSLFVTLQDRNEVVALSPDLKVLKRIRLAGSQPTGLALDAKAGRIYVAIRYAVIALNPDTGAELSRVPTPAGADKLWYDEASATLLAASSGGTVNVIRTEAGKMVSEDELRTDVRGHTLAYDPSRKLIFMPGGREGRSKLVILKRIEASPLTPNAEQVAQRR